MESRFQWAGKLTFLSFFFSGMKLAKNKETLARGWGRGSEVKPIMRTLYYPNEKEEKNGIVKFFVIIIRVGKVERNL